MNAKQRIKRLEDSKAAQTNAVNLAGLMQIKRVNYRAGIPDESGIVQIPDPPDTFIKIRHIDMTNEVTK